MSADPKTDHDVNTPHAVPAAAEDPARTDKAPKHRQEDLLDEGIEETFPASDPVSVKRIT